MTTSSTEPRSRVKHTKALAPSTPGPSTSTSTNPQRRVATAKSTKTRTAMTSMTPSRGDDVFGDISSPSRTNSPAGPSRARGPLREYGDRFIPNREPESSHGCYDLLPEVDLGSDKEDKEEQDERKKVFSGKSDSEARREEVNAVFNKLLKDEMFPAILSPTRASSPAPRNQPSPSRHAKLRKPMTHYTTNIPLSPANHPVSSAGHTPLHHHPLPDMYPSDLGGKEDREMSPASTLPPLPQHGPATPISGHGRAPGAGPTSAHHRAHQSQMALTYEADEQTTPPRSRRKTRNEFEPEHPDEAPAPDTPSKKRVLNFQSPTTKRMSQLTNGYGIGDLGDMRHEKYSLSPVGHDSQQMLLSPRKGIRQMARTPFKVLDAPELTDDFYLNLVSWSTSNVLGVGLNNTVYLWSASTSKVTKLCDMGGEGSAHPGDTVTGLEWTNKGSTIALGTDKGSVEIWDAEYCKKIRTMSGHTDRVGALAWNNHILSTGSQDRSIFHRDTRVKEQYIRKLAGHHKQEVCGLKWNLDTDQLASGGNDNKMFIWNGTENRPTWRFGEHRAAVKALAWSPHARGILASGGGTADKKIRFWNSLTGGLVSEWDTGSQVCNLMWSRNSNELVSTHGYAPGSGAQNQIHIWKYPSMTQVATLSAHSFRVLYIAMSPDGQTIVTGAGDETLRFWNAFELERGKKSVVAGKAEPVNPFLSKIR